MYAGAEIKYHASGKPYLLNSDTNISISHSKNLVCILLNKSNNIGVDVQYISERINRLKEKFLSNKELLQLPSNNKTEALHVYWCAKEALYKLGGQEYADFKKSLHIHSFGLSNEGAINGTMHLKDQQMSVRLFYEKTGEYFLVYTIDKL
jgi:phosphopantetheinyl transferase